MAGRVYVRAKDGEWIEPRSRGYRQACCDCGLVHQIDFRVVKSGTGARVKVQFRAFRDKRATAGMRAAKAQP